MIPKWAIRRQHVGGVIVLDQECYGRAEQHHENQDAAIPSSFKKPRIHPPEMMGNVRLSSNDPKSARETHNISQHQTWFSEKKHTQSLRNTTNNTCHQPNKSQPRPPTPTKMLSGSANTTFQRPGHVLPSIPERCDEAPEADSDQGACDRGGGEPCERLARSEGEAEDGEACWELACAGAVETAECGRGCVSP